MTVRPPRVRGAWIDAVLACVAVVSGACALAYQAHAERPVPDHVGSWIAIYGRAAPRIPAGARLGIVSAVADGAQSGAETDLAQYALAPRVLDFNLAAVDWVISTPGAPASLDGDPRLAGFDLAAVLNAGIRLYRRRP